MTFSLMIYPSTTHLPTPKSLCCPKVCVNHAPVILPPMCLYLNESLPAFDLYEVEFILHVFFDLLKICPF